MTTMHTTITIIIPVFNAARYLAECLDSVLAQTYPHFELILIDDGSVDHSAELCDKYAQQDHRIRVIHTTNGGPSQARNIGLDAAIGEWVLFIDADDWVDTQYVASLVEAADKDDMLVVQGIYCEKQEMVDKTLISFDAQVLCATSYHKLFAELKLQGCAYSFSKLFNRAIIEKHKIRFNPEIFAREDLIFLLQYLLAIETVKFIPQSHYHYRMDSGGLHTQIMSFISENRLSKALCVLIDQMDNRQIANYDFEELRHTAAACLMTSILVHYRPGHIIPRSERLTLLHRLTAKDLELIRTYYIVPRRALAVPVYLIKHQRYRLFDSFLITLFRFRFFQ